MHKSELDSVINDLNNKNDFEGMSFSVDVNELVDKLKTLYDTSVGTEILQIHNYDMQK